MTMPTTITELADATAFERLVLDRALPLMPSSGGAASVVDLGTSGSIIVAVTPQPAVANVLVIDPGLVTSWAAPPDPRSPAS